MGHPLPREESDQKGWDLEGEDKSTAQAAMEREPSRATKAAEIHGPVSSMPDTKLQQD